MDGTVSCRRFANIVEDSPAFKETGSSIAKLLRVFSDKIMDTGVALEDMYRNGDMLFLVLNNEISEMMPKFNTFNRWFENEDEIFFKSRVHRLVESIEEFKRKVTHARIAIVDAESYGGSVEKKVRQSITEATKFIHHDHDRVQYILKLKEEGYILEKITDNKAIDVLNAMDELKHVENMLIILEKSHEALDIIIKILSFYKNKLFDFKAQLGKINKSRVTKKDMSKLERLVNILKSNHQKFNGKDTR
jgi:predicted RND superfamily exporter protein